MADKHYQPDSLPIRVFQVLTGAAVGNVLQII